MLSEFLLSDWAKQRKIFDQFEPSFSTVLNLKKLVSHVLQPLRWQVGRIIVTSGYRCEEVNRAVGGVNNSQHLSGKAVDFKCANLDEAVNVLRVLPFDQLILYPEFIHVSYDAELLRKQIIKKH